MQFHAFRNQGYPLNALESPKSCGLFLAPVEFNNNEYLIRNITGFNINHDSRNIVPKPEKIRHI